MNDALHTHARTRMNRMLNANLFPGKSPCFLNQHTKHAEAHTHGPRRRCPTEDANVYDQTHITHHRAAEQ